MCGLFIIFANNRTARLCHITTDNAGLAVVFLIGAGMKDIFAQNPKNIVS